MADQDPAPEGQDNPDADRPEWLPANFKSPEDLARSYTESQRKITELSTQNKGLEESIGNLSAQFEQFTAAQNQPDPDAVYGQWSQAYEQDPIGTMAQIAQATAQQTIQQFAAQQNQPLQATQQTQSALVAAYADQAMAGQFEDWNDVKGKVADFISDQPDMFHEGLFADPTKATRALETAYKMVKADDVLSGNTVAQQQQADTRQMKLNAQTAVGASGRPVAPAGDTAEWDAIKNAAPATYYKG